MNISLEQFVHALSNSGVLSSNVIRDVLSSTGELKTAESLARDLVKRSILTQFQARTIWRGRAGSLVLGNYLLLDIIGEGGMGKVYRAQHRLMDRIVALKVLPADRVSSPSDVERFRREVRTAASLIHRNIVTAYDADQVGSCQFLVMEYVDGPDLATYVRNCGPLSIALALEFIAQAARGLEFAHEKGIVHRDIKPANLLLAPGGTVKILDLGLAKVRSSRQTHSPTELTNSGALIGTVDFMSPEQAADPRIADERADIYSLGCTLFYFLSGHSLFPSDSVMARLLAHRDQAPPALPELDSRIAGPLNSLFLKMVAKLPKDRYESMSALLAELIRLQGKVGSGPGIQALDNLQNIQRDSSTLTSFDSIAGDESEIQSTRRPLVSINHMDPEETFITDHTDPESYLSQLAKLQTVRQASFPVQLIGFLVLILGAVGLILYQLPSLTPFNNWLPVKHSESTDRPPSDANRRIVPASQAALAREILLRTGTVHIHVGGTNQMVTDISRLPSSPFEITAISLDRKLGVDDAFVTSWPTLPFLTFVDLTGADIDDSAADLLKQPKLKDLYLGGTRLSDESMNAVISHPNLSLIAVFDSKVTAQGLSPLAKARNLVVLGIDGRQFSTESESFLETLPHLIELHLVGQDVTDEHLHRVQRLTRLKTVVLSNTSTTVAGVKALRNVRPQLMIRVDSPGPLIQ